jgi:cell division transport system ATP-binding protein
MTTGPGLKAWAILADIENIMISLTNVGKEYRKGRWALCDVSFTIQKGEFVVLSGASGAGKTTLMKLISLEERPTEGQLSVEGFASHEIKKRQLPYFRRRIGPVFQDFRLLRDRSAYENVAFVLRATGAKHGSLHRRVIRALAAVGLSGRGDAMPHELSGGEQQRIGIARAIVGDPFIVLADEPTGNLDDANKREIFQMLKKISSAGTAVLVATHDLNVAREMRARTLILDNGRLVRDAMQTAQGPPPPGPSVVRPIAAGGLRS